MGQSEIFKNLKKLTRKDIFTVATFCIGGIAAALFISSTDGCRADMERYLLDGPYKLVPDRADYAAKRLCDRINVDETPQWLSHAH